MRNENKTPSVIIHRRFIEKKSLCVTTIYRKKKKASVLLFTHLGLIVAYIYFNASTSFMRIFVIQTKCKTYIYTHILKRTVSRTQIQLMKNIRFHHSSNAKMRTEYFFWIKCVHIYIS